MQKTKVITVTNLKGGVAKTTTTVNLSAALVKSGYKVLLVDWDPQGNSSGCFGFNKNVDFVPLINAIDDSQAEYFDVKKLKPYQTNSFGDRLMILPNNFQLAKFESKVKELPGYQFILSNIFKVFDGKVDFIIIDTNPSLSPLTLNAYHASDYLLIPVEAGVDSEDGLDMVLTTVKRINQHFDKPLKVAGAFFCKHQDNLVISKDYTARYKEDRDDLSFFDTYIRNNVALKEAREMEMDIFSYDEYLSEGNEKEILSNGAEDYYNLCNEFLYRVGIKDRLDTSREEVKEKPVTRKKVKGELKSDFLAFLNS